MLWFGDRKRSRPTDARTLVVPRHLDAAYYYFLEFYTRANGLELVVDRRCQERRAAPSVTAPDRRRGDRRGQPPATWQQADFVLIRSRQSPELAPEAAATSTQTLDVSRPSTASPTTRL